MNDIIRRGMRATEAEDVRPRLKQTSPVYQVEEGSLTVLGCGSLLEIDDPAGDVRRLLSLLDGGRTIGEVRRDFAAAAPGSELVIDDALRELDRAGLLIDADEPTILDDRDRERWKRNLGFFETYATLSSGMFAMQERLRECKVVLFGLGGVGSHLSLDLLGLGVRDLRIVDFDTVELSNLNRQILYTEDEIGRPKVELAIRRLKAYNPDARIEGIERKITSVDDIRELVADREFAFCMFDRPKLKAVRWANEACVSSGVPFMTGGVQTQRAMTYLVLPGRTGCVECWRLSAAADAFTLALRDQMEIRHGQITVGPDMAAFGPLVTTMTAMVVTEFVRVVTGIAAPISAGRLVEMRFDDLVLREAESWSRRPDCPVCAGVEPCAEQPGYANPTAQPEVVVAAPA